MAVGEIKQKASPFLNMKKSWEEEDFHISPEILKGILAELNFDRPSQIQAVAIPLIVKTDSDGNFVNLIAQSKNGSGKTGAYSIGSVMRVDPSI
jgi:superfamily II DNA/RNA helicase